MAFFIVILKARRGPIRVKTTAVHCGLKSKHRSKMLGNDDTGAGGGNRSTDWLLLLQSFILCVIVLTECM